MVILDAPNLIPSTWSAAKPETALINGGTDRDTSSLIRDPHVLHLLDRIVCSLSYEAFLRQDLMQEALIHLWQMERARPGQSKSWYLQSCRFRLQHYLSAGRSLDATKRRAAQAFACGDIQDSSEILGDLESADQGFGEACARDLLAIISASLQPPERAVLRCLAEGMRTTDIARALKLSLPTVRKYRRKIARLTAKYEVGCCLASPGSDRGF